MCTVVPHSCHYLILELKVRRIKNHQILQPEACTISRRTTSGKIQKNKHNKQDTQKQWSSNRTLPNNAMVFNLLEFNKQFKYY
jgi:hypothetical protein